jgi:hypothetical protein
MQQTHRVAWLVLASMVYFGALIVFVAPHAYGANVPAQFGLLVLATIGFLIAWRCLARRAAVPLRLAMSCGLFGGIAIGIVELALASLSTSANTALAVGGAEFGVSFLLLLGVWLAGSEDSGADGSRSFLTRRRRVSSGLALGAGMWLGTVATILIAILLAMSYGVRGSLSG